MAGPADLLPKERELLFSAWQGLIAPQRFAWQTVTESLLDLRGSQARGCVSKLQCILFLLCLFFGSLWKLWLVVEALRSNLWAH